MRKVIQTIFVLSVAFACSEEVDDLSVMPGNSSFEIAEKQMTIFGESILPRYDDAGFRDLVYAEIEKQFDGDFNVLIKTLAEKNPESADLTNKLTAFYDLVKKYDNRQHEPQIFIPFYEELKQKVN